MELLWFTKLQVWPRNW